MKQRLLWRLIYQNNVVVINLLSSIVVINGDFIVDTPNDVGWFIAVVIAVLHLHGINSKTPPPGPLRPQERNEMFT